MSDWDPARRDQELRHISNVTKGVAAVAVGGTVLLGAGIAWGDQQRVEQADNREATPSPAVSESADSTIQPPKTTPAPASTPASTPASGSSSSGRSKSKSGGS